MSSIRHLVRELHRRSVWQVLGIYLVGSWAAYQVVLSLVEGLGLPDWVPPMAVVLFVIGLPIVLATAFVQEGLPGGESARSPADVTGAASDDEVPAGMAEPAASPIRVAASTSVRPGLFTWKRAIAGGVIAFTLLGIGVVAFMGMRSLGIGPLGSLVGKGELEASDYVLVAEFNPLTGDSTIASVVSEAMRVDLSQSDLLNVVDRSRIRYALERMGRPASAQLSEDLAREVAVRLGVKAVVEGEVGEVAGSYLLSATLVTPDSARVLASFRETAADSTDLLPAVDRLSRQLREKAGESLRTIRENPPLTQVTTTSLDALRKYVRAREVSASGDRGTAIVLLENALALDPEFASAHRSLATHFWNRGRRGDSTFWHINEAVRLGDRLTESERRHARAFQAIATYDLQEARRQYEMLLANDSADHVAIVNLGVVYSLLGENERALELAQRAYDVGDRAINTTYWNIVQGQLNLGRYDEAATTVRLAAADHPASGTVNVMRWLVAKARGDRAAVDSILAELESGESPGPERWLRNLTDLHRGRPGWLDDIHAEAPVPVARFMSAIPLGWVDLFIRRNPTAAADRLEATLAALDRQNLALEELPLPTAALVLAVAGRTGPALEVVREFRTEVRPELLGQHEVMLRAARGMAEVMRGEHETGLEHLAWARSRSPCRPCLDALGGVAFEAAGRPDSALAAYDRYLTTPWADRHLYNGPGTVPNDPFVEVYVRDRLASLYEAAGDTEAAARQLSTITELWQDPAPELQPQLRELRSRLARLVGEPGT